MAPFFRFSEGVQNTGWLINPWVWFNFAVFVAPWRPYGIATISGNLTFWRFAVGVTWILFVFRLLVRRRLSRSVYSSGLLFLAALNAALVAVTILYSPYLFEGDAGTRATVKALGWVWIASAGILLSSEAHVVSALRVYLLSAIGPLIVGWVQWIAFTVFQQRPSLPFARLLVDEGARAAVQYNAYVRPASTFLEPNYYGLFLITIVLMCLYQVVYRAYVLNRRLTWVILLASFGQLIASLSLSAALGFLAGLLYLLVMAVRVHKLNVVSRLVAAGTVMLTLALLLYGTGNPLVAGLVLKVKVKVLDSEFLFDRGPFFLGVWKALEESAGLGVGFGGLTPLTGVAISSGHAALLTVLAEQGLIAFAAVLLWAVWVLRRLTVQDESPMSTQASGALAPALVGTLVGNLGYDAMFYFDASWSLLALSQAAAVITRPQSPMRKRGMAAYGHSWRSYTHLQ